MKGVVDFILGLVVLLVGVVLLFLAFLNVRDQQSSLPEVIGQNRVTANRASTQDSVNTSLVQCAQSSDQQIVAEALYSTFSRIWGPEGLLVVLGRGGVENTESWTVYCGPENEECRQNVGQFEVAGCLSPFGPIHDESSWFFAKGAAFGNVCSIIDNNNQFIEGEGDGSPQGSDCNHHGDCQLTQYCYAGLCLDCPEGYKRRGATFSQGVFWFLRNFRLASFLKLLFSPLQANPNSEGAFGTEGDPGNQGGNQNTQENENQGGYNHPFCEPCSEQEMEQCSAEGVSNPN